MGAGVATQPQHLRMLGFFLARNSALQHETALETLQSAHSRQVHLAQQPCIGHTLARTKTVTLTRGNSTSMSIDKRFFLKAMTVSGAGAAMHGCAVVPQAAGDSGHATATGHVQPAAADASHSVQGVYRPRPFTPEEIRLADEARQTFEQGTFGGPAGQVSRAALESALQAVRREAAPFRGSRTVPLEQAVPLALAVTGMLKLVEMGKSAPRTQTASRRPELPPIQINGSAIVVPPRSKVQFTQKGYCMDSSLPAPGQGEKFTLRPMNQLIVPELLPLYQALQLQAKTDHRTRRAMQTLVWALREAGTKSRYVHAISKPHLEMMERAQPGGAQLFVNYHQQQYAKNFNPVGELLGRLLTVRIDGRNVNLANLFNSNDPRAADDLTDRTMEDLMSRPVPGEIPKDSSDYTMLQPGVAAHAVGRSQLTPTITVANTTDQPFVFDTKDYYAQTQRQAQRVGLGPPQNVAHVVNEPVVLPEVTAFGRAMEEAIQELIITSMANLARWAMLYALERGSRFHASQLANKTPFLGSAVQLSNLVRGRDWYTDDPLNCVQQTVGALSTEPGAGQFLKQAGGNPTAAVNRLANNAVKEGVIKSGERTQFTRSVMDWLSSEPAKTAARSSGVQGPVSSRVNEVMTGGCQKAWS